MPRLFFLASPRLATPKCNAMDLFSALLAVEPGLVLEERSPKGDPDGAAREGGEKSDHGSEPSIEEEAVASYASSRECIRLSYDMPGWQEAARKNGYLAVESEFLGELKRMAEKKRLAAEDLSALASLESAKRVYDELFSLTLAQLNRASFSERLETAEDMQYSLVSGALGRYAELSRYAGRFARIRALLAERRKAMADAVLTALGRNRADTAVLVGAAEKGRLERATVRTASLMGYTVDSLWK